MPNARWTTIYSKGCKRFSLSSEGVVSASPIRRRKDRTEATEEPRRSLRTRVPPKRFGYREVENVAESSGQRPDEDEEEKRNNSNEGPKSTGERSRKTSSGGPRRKIGRSPVPPDGSVQVACVPAASDEVGTSSSTIAEPSQLMAGLVPGSPPQQATVPEDSLATTSTPAWFTAFLQNENGSLTVNQEEVMALHDEPTEYMNDQDWAVAVRHLMGLRDFEGFMDIEDDGGVEEPPAVEAGDKEYRPEEFASVASYIIKNPQAVSELLQELEGSNNWASHDQEGGPSEDDEACVPDVDQPTINQPGEGHWLGNEDTLAMEDLGGSFHCKVVLNGEDYVLGGRAVLGMLG